MWHVLDYKFYRLRHGVIYFAGSIYVFGGFE